MTVVTMVTGRGVWDLGWDGGGYVGRVEGMHVMLSLRLSTDGAWM